MRYISLLFLVIIVGCVSPKKIRYVQDIDSTELLPVVNVVELAPNDIITISLASERMEAVQGFLKQSYTPLSQSELKPQTTEPEYLLNSTGEINFPQLGLIKLAGLTIKEAEERISERLLPFVNDITVEIRIRNFKVTVLGDVLRPGTFSITDDKISILQALGLAGDLNITGDRKRVKVIRENTKGKTAVNLDLTSSGFINSDYYYLKQNDVIIVEPNKSKIQTSGFYNTATFFVSIASVLSTMVIVLVSNNR